MGNAERFAEEETQIKVKVAELGGMYVGPYEGRQKGILLMCPSGHAIKPVASSVMKSERIPCRSCFEERQSAEAKALFLSRMDELGATVTGRYLTIQTPVNALCKNGHACAPRPSNVRNGQGICRTCAGQNPVVAEANFRARVEELGGEVLGQYRGTGRPVLVRCAEGHLSEPYPNNVRNGEGVCRFCKGRKWDVFYVVEGDNGIKFGISSGDGRARLTDHKRDGYWDVLVLRTGLPGMLALSLETELKNVLKAAGVAPVRGREYFGPEAKQLVMPVVDAWL